MSKSVVRISETSCSFCEIIAGKLPVKIVAVWPHAIAIKPLNPVTEGHLLVLPREHVKDARENTVVTAEMALCATELAVKLYGDFNLIVNAGPDASQTVWHLHWHIVPRRAGDGLQLPWTRQSNSGIISDPYPRVRR
jgi:histidine triad (HIT) family protein